MAGLLRERILSGEIAADGRLPREEVLRAEFGVGKPAMREALRMLEEEGLVSVVRGNRGGAIVQMPRAENIGYSLGLALTARGVMASDLKDALLTLEPLCAGLCARRDDRRQAVVPPLLAIHREAEDHLDDVSHATALFRRFHEQLVALCGNETLILLVGAVESLWSSHVTSSATAASDGETGRDVRDLPSSLDEHRKMINLIERGDPDQLTELVAEHLQRVQRIPTAANAESRLNMSDLRFRLRL